MFGNISGILVGVQVFFAIVIGLYFWNMLRSQQNNKTAINKESKKEMDQLEKLRSISLTEPLAEKARPKSLHQIIGQEEGLKALRAALCGSNPQHVLVYGPPGVGKTAAARLIMEEAKRNPDSPFNQDSRFVELDATTARFDERGIADPLMGSVHDPIYQGAGPLGMAGIPQPKPGAVTKAHGGVLFIDEIGELHPYQLNKLLKVLEDRKVFLESAYYNSEDPNIPRYIHEIFQNGLPADFRLIGATTRQPAEISPAIRSRCVEVFFRGLQPQQVGEIAVTAAANIDVELSQEALEVIKSYATNGREAVNIIQMAAGIALGEGRNRLEKEDLEWVVSASQISPRPERKIPAAPQVGVVNGLAVYGPNMGMLMQIEAVAVKAGPDKGSINVTGIVDEEEMGSPGHTLRRKSMARGSVENVITALRSTTGIKPRDYDIHINFPGGIPTDGPSAGLSLAVAIYSAIAQKPVDNTCAFTGEISIQGRVCPVGGVRAKLEAALHAGAKKVFIPDENAMKNYGKTLKGLDVVPVGHLQELFRKVFKEEDNPIPQSPIKPGVPVTPGVISANPF